MALCIALCLSTSTRAAAAAPAGDDADPAQVHFEQAAALYEQQDYAGAAQEFAIAHALAPSVDVLFAWAQAERLAGEYAVAIELYQKLLDGRLSKTQRAAIESLMTEVEAELAAEQAEPQPEPLPEPEPSCPPTEPAPEHDEPRTRDRLGPALVGTGAALTLVGGGLLLGGVLRDARVRNADSYTAFESAYDPGSGRGRGAVALYASGGVLAGVGVAALIVGALRMSEGRSSARERVAIVPWLGREQAGVMLTIGAWR